MSFSSIVRHIAATACIIFQTSLAFAQIRLDNGLELDKNVHNFGETILNSGAVSCSFTVTNKGESPVVIQSVVSSCGCTDVDWTRKPLKKGESGTISATYSNDEAPVPFDKNLTVYFSGMKKPYILKLRGICKAPEPDKYDIYSHKLGALRFTETQASVGQVSQGLTKSVRIAGTNSGDSAVKLSFDNISDGLSVSLRKAEDGGLIEDGMIGAGADFDLVFSVTADREHWGKNQYLASPSVGGKKMKDFKIFAFLVENFDKWSPEQKRKGPNPMIKESNYCFGTVKSGRSIDAEFEISNSGNKLLKIYKCDTDARAYSHSDIYPIKPGESGKFRVHIDSSLMPKGETTVTVTITTNSALRPFVHLFIVGTIK